MTNRDKALREFVDVITATGGIKRDNNGHPCPLGNEDWIDLGEAYLLACEALCVKPVEAPSDDLGDDEGPMLRVHYRCPACGHEWNEEWSSACDSECGECGLKSIEASEWEDIE